MTDEIFYLVITHHARERWVERISDPDKYSHLSTCQGCAVCHRLMNQIKTAVEFAKRHIDYEIMRRYRYARRENHVVNDVSFLQAQLKLYREDFPLYEFYQNGNAVFIIKNDVKPPVLTTILSQDMIDGTAIRTMKGSEMKEVFNRWKFENKQSKRRNS